MSSYTYENAAAERAARRRRDWARWVESLDTDGLRRALTALAPGGDETPPPIPTHTPASPEPACATLGPVTGTGEDAAVTPDAAHAIATVVRWLVYGGSDQTRPLRLDLLAESLGLTSGRLTAAEIADHHHVTRAEVSRVAAYIRDHLGIRLSFQRSTQARKSCKTSQQIIRENRKRITRAKSLASLLPSITESQQ